MKKKKIPFCLFPGCRTILGKLSDKRFCHVHIRITCQHDIVYRRGGFYKNRNGKFFKLSSRYVHSLKEIGHIEDILI
jgi:hypothetical protein